MFYDGMFDVCEGMLHADVPCSGGATYRATVVPRTCL